MGFVEKNGLMVSTSFGVHSKDLQASLIPIPKNIKPLSIKKKSVCDLLITLSLIKDMFYVFEQP